METWKTIEQRKVIKHQLLNTKVSSPKSKEGQRAFPKKDNEVKRNLRRDERKVLET